MYFFEMVTVRIPIPYEFTYITENVIEKGIIMVNQLVI